MAGREALTEAEQALQRHDPASAGTVLIGLLAEPDDCSLTEIRMLLQRAGAQGHPESRFVCAAMMLRGHGGPRDEAEAVRLLHAVLENTSSDDIRGHAHALLGDCYARGSGIDADETLAFSHYHKAADCGVPDSAFKIGLAYDEGLFGKPADVPTALRFYVPAAAAGHAQAMANIVLLYMSGKAKLPLDESVRELLQGPLPTDDPGAAALIDSSRRTLVEWLKEHA